MSNFPALQQMAKRLAVKEDELQRIVMSTVMPNKGNGVTNEQFVSFMVVANEYRLNPLTKEIYAFPAKGGGIQPIVSIDGWLKIINNHPDFNGMTFEDVRGEDGKLISIKCRIYKKGIEHPIEVEEYMDECFQGNKEPWQKWPSRMLRHKSAIQGGRYAFGLSGIIDPDEAERYKESGVIEGEHTKEKQPESLPPYPDDDLKAKSKTWADYFKAGKSSPEHIISKISSKYAMTESQKNAIRALAPIEGEAEPAEEDDTDDFLNEMNKADEETQYENVN